MLNQQVGYSSMQASQKQENLDQSYYWTTSENIDQLLYPPADGNGSQGSHFSIQTSDYGNNSTSSVSFSPNGSPMSQADSHSYPQEIHCSSGNAYNSNISRRNLIDDVEDLNLQHKLRELESVMFGPDQDFVGSHDFPVWDGDSQVSSKSDKFQKLMEMISRGDLKEVLLSCAKAVAENDIITAEWLISELRPMVSVSGEPKQRLGAYLLEGLVARLASSGSSIYKSLRCKEPTSGELFSYMHLLYEVCPYFKFGYLSANGAIAEAMKNENKIHIVDFQITQGSQWFTLIQALAARPGGPPQVCITGIDDSISAYARGGGLEIVGQRLSKLAESCKVPFEFHPVSISGTKIEAKDLRIKRGEALAVNFAFALHHMPDESVGPQNHRDRLLRLVKSLNPKVLTLVEQESSTNTAPLFPRFMETMNYYSAIFDSIDVTLPRDHKERINVEQHCLARDIVNIIACEGQERVERHELLGKWRSRLAMAGFTPFSLSSYVNATIKNLLENYCESYRLEEKDGALYLGWMDRDLVASSAWK